MRIEAYNQVAQLYQGSKTANKQKSSGAAAGRDHVTISQAGYDYQIVKKAVAETPDIREDKVAHVWWRYSKGRRRSVRTPSPPD